MKIIQILVTPDNSTYQGQMLGLGDDGVTYYAENKGWKEYFGAHISGADKNTVTISREVYEDTKKLLQWIGMTKEGVAIYKRYLEADQK